MRSRYRRVQQYKAVNGGQYQYFYLCSRYFVLLPACEARGNFLRMVSPCRFYQDSARFFPSGLVPRIFRQKAAIQASPFFQKGVTKSLFCKGNLVRVYAGELFSSNPYVFFCGNRHFFLLSSFLLVEAPNLFTKYSGSLPFRFVCHLIRIHGDTTRLFCNDSRVRGNLFLFFVHIWWGLSRVFYVVERNVSILYFLVPVVGRMQKCNGRAKRVMLSV